MGPCVMNIAPSSDTGKNVNWSVAVEIPTAAHMSRASVSASQVSKQLPEIFITESVESINTNI